MTAADAQHYAEIEANSGASNFAAGIPQAADSVLEDAAREAIDKVLALFPFNAPIQTFTIGGGPCLTADGDTEFYSAKRIWALLREVKTTLDAARKQGVNHD